MRARYVVPALLLVILALPFVLRAPSDSGAGRADERLIVISPHNEAIRFEFENGFAAWYRERTGRTVDVDWRIIGGTSEINRFLASEYITAFRNHWTGELGRPWSADVEAGFQTDAVPRDLPEAAAATRREARAAFLASDVGIGIDVFFGGGAFDFERHAAGGRLVATDLVERQPGWFADDVFPQRVRGEVFRDARHRWFGATISSFGIVYNLDSLARLGLAPPAQWADLGDPRYVGQLALADPTKSGSINKAFEMILQQQMQIRLAELLAAGVEPADAERRAIREGWTAGLRLIQRLGGNARYWTDSSQKPPIDVGSGNSAAGMAIDFYGRFQAERSNERGGRPRVGFVTPVGGSTYSVDPVAVLRGAPEAEIASLFLEYVLSPEAQLLWNVRVGEDGGPVRYNLRRQPVRGDVYTAAHEAARSDPGVNPFGPNEKFEYREAWTGRIFSEIAFVIRVMALDSGPELKAAWRALIANDFPPEAVAVFENVDAVAYDRVVETLSPVLRGRTTGARLDQIRLGRELAADFRRQYVEAARLAHRRGAD